MPRFGPSSAAILLPFALAVSLPPSPCSAATLPQLPPSTPAGFVANAGQWDAGTRFATRRGLLDARLEADGIRIHRTGSRHELAVRFGVPLDVRGESERTTRYHHFVGNERGAWRTSVPAYDRVRYEGIAPGTDVVVHHGEQGIQYDLELAADTKVDDIVLQCTGADGLEVADDGALLVRLGDEVVRQTPPMAWQVAADGAHVPVPCAFRIVDEHSYGFATAPLDPRLQTVVDPQLDYATWLGGTVYDSATAVAVDAHGAIYVLGESLSPDIAPTGPIHGANPDNQAIFVAKLDPTAVPGQSLLWIAVVGGSDGDWPLDLEVDPTGTAVILVGATASADFPTSTPTAALQNHHGNLDGFVTCLDTATGSVLGYSVLIGDSGVDACGDVAFLANGDAVVTGARESTGTTGFSGDPNPILHGTRGGNDCFVTVLTASGAWSHASVFGGAGDDGVRTITVDANGNVFVFGSSANDPTQPAGWFPRVLAGPKVPAGGGGGRGRQAAPSTDADWFVARLDPLLDLQFATLLGGSDSEFATSMALDGSRLHLVGETESGDVVTVAPVTGNGIDGSLYAGDEDGLVVTLDFAAFVPGATGPSTTFTSYFGTRNRDGITRVAVDANGNLVLLGSISPSHGPKSFPAVGTPQLKAARIDGNRDGFLVALTPSANSRTYAYGSLIGGDFDESGVGLALAPDGSWVVALSVYGSDLYTTPNAVQQTRPSVHSAYVRALPAPSGL